MSATPDNGSGDLSPFDKVFLLVMLCMFVFVAGVSLVMLLTNGLKGW